MPADQQQHFAFLHHVAAGSSCSRSLPASSPTSRTSPSTTLISHTSPGATTQRGPRYHPRRRRAAADGGYLPADAARRRQLQRRVVHLPGAQNFRRFSNMSQVTEGMFECAQKVTKSAKNAEKIQIFAAERVYMMRSNAASLGVHTECPTKTPGNISQVRSNYINIRPQLFSVLPSRLDALLIINYYARRTQRTNTAIKRFAYLDSDIKQLHVQTSVWATVGAFGEKKPSEGFGLGAFIQTQQIERWGNKLVGSAAVYIYGIYLSNPANITFTLDGNAAPFHYYAGSEQFVFKSLFFFATALATTANHTVSWILHASKTNVPLCITETTFRSRLKRHTEWYSNGTTGLIDYAVIMADESTVAPSGTPAPSQSSPSSTESKSKTGPIVGGVVAGSPSSQPSSSQWSSCADGGAGLQSPHYCREKERLRKHEQHAQRTYSPSWSRRRRPFDAAWMNPSLNPPSTTDLSSVLASASVAASSSAVAPSSTTAPSARDRELEDRIAQLEAQVIPRIHNPAGYGGLVW
ncbi:hypothetical protein B0H19DRAFT_1067704 [Mycena capillaripes]|nr:hypothetical protein B0H19DRAFT_1067704 [Mycena capillaripes]